ncbi:hypothetical protein DH2020_025911 [Rehmannia glutinosa]|uniref:DUF4378 domain-containing protein n=1 Tax=Rehmannia glutinosa TaxID=99300 RepID=A0ABR0VZB8_REHGL
MERARHRKSKSASGIEDSETENCFKIVSDSRSYIDGSKRNDTFMLDLGQSSLRGTTGIPMKKLLAEEMSKEVEPKRRSPSVIARLMGLEGLPSPRNVHGQQKAEFKDVYEDLEASHVGNRRCSSRWSASSILTKPEMALIQQKFIDAKRLSTDEKLQGSKQLDDTLEMLDSNKDLLLKYLGQPDSLFVKHLHDQQVDTGSTLGNHIAVLKPSKSEKYESKAKAWRSERDTSSNHHVTSHLKREDGLLLEPQSRHRAHISRNSSRIQFEEKNEEKILPTRIPSFKKTKEYPSVEGAETVSRRRKGSSHDVGLSKPISREAREIAREITMRMRDGCDETMDAKSVGFRGYVGDESSYDANESDSESESEVFKLSCRNSFDDNNFRRYPSSCLGESSVSREAKKRLSERWKMTHKYQDLEMVSKGSTLGEMLALPDRVTRHNHVNAKTSFASNRHGRDNGTAIWDGPLGISSRDGWKDEITRYSSRSRSLPPSTGGRGRSHRSTYHDELAEEKSLMDSEPVQCGRIKSVKGNLSHKEDYSSKYSKSRGKKPHPYQHMLIDEIDSSSEANFEIQMEANIKDVSEQQSIFHVDANTNTCRSPVVDVMMISEPGSTTLSSKSSELLPEQSSSVIDGDESAAHEQTDISLQQTHITIFICQLFLCCFATNVCGVTGTDKGGAVNGADFGNLATPSRKCCIIYFVYAELHKGPPKQGSPSLQSVGAELESSESSKEADHPSPISVLEVPFTEDASSSESFERVSAELHELRMQLQLLKMESSSDAEVSTPFPIEEEEFQLSPIVSEGNFVLEADEGWEISYSLDVLTNSGLEESDFDMFRTSWYSPDCPLDPKLFDNLEKKHSDQTTGSRTERKLLFDRINSALLQIFEEHVDLCPWVMPKLTGLDLKWQKEAVGDAIEKLIDRELANREVSDKVLDREMQWLDSKGEIDMIGNEIEKLLIDDMIAEKCGGGGGERAGRLRWCGGSIRMEAALCPRDDPILLDCTWAFNSMGLAFEPQAPKPNTSAKRRRL